MEIEMRPSLLTYLSLRHETPKPLATYYPQIEDEFLPSKASAWRREQKSTDKGMKRKAKQMEKEAARELKKDTLMIQ